MHGTFTPVPSTVAADLPDWPRLLSSDLAAKYLGIGRTMFLDRVKDHTLPTPRRIGGRVLWHRGQLDRYADALFGLDGDAEPALDPADDWDDV